MCFSPVKCCSAENQGWTLLINFESMRDAFKDI